MSVEQATKGPESKSEPMVILHRDISTQNQVGTLLQIGGHMMDFLATDDKEAAIIPGARPLPGEARLAAETTLIKVCSRLDDILDNNQRWGIDFQLRLEKIFTESNARQRKWVEEDITRSISQRLAADEVRSPHFRYRPILFELKDGTWAAFLGDQNDLAHGIVGNGASPAEALKEFDLVFAGQMSKNMKAIIGKREKELNEIDSLDSNGIKATEEISGGRPDGTPDSGPVES